MITGFFCAVICNLYPGQVMIDHQSQVWMNNAKVGVYVDNEAPMQAEELSNVEGMRLAGIAPYLRYLPEFPGSIRLRQFYPYTLNEHPRKGDGYILPASFHWENRKPYSMKWRQKMWCWVKKRNPLMVIWYGWTDNIGPKIQTMMLLPCFR
jgi:hypothetical protein